MSKGIAILQSLWFILQRKRGLALTELELEDYFRWDKLRWPSIIGEEESKDDVSLFIFSDVLDIYWLFSDANSSSRIIRNAVAILAL